MKQIAKRVWVSEDLENNGEDSFFTIKPSLTLPEYVLSSSCFFLEEVDLSIGERHNHPSIVEGQTYLALIYNKWHLGTFSKQWFGWNFFPWYGVGLQFDSPGYNGSAWKKLYVFKAPTE